MAVYQVASKCFTRAVRACEKIDEPEEDDEEASLSAAGLFVKECVYE